MNNSIGNATKTPIVTFPASESHVLSRCQLNTRRPAAPHSCPCSVAHYPSVTRAQTKLSTQHNLMCKAAQRTCKDLADVGVGLTPQRDWLGFAVAQQRGEREHDIGPIRCGKAKVEDIDVTRNIEVLLPHFSSLKGADRIAQSDKLHRADDVDEHRWP